MRKMWKRVAGFLLLAVLLALMPVYAWAAEGDPLLSVDDLLEDLRLNGVFDLRQVAFAQIETNGQLSVLLQGAETPATAGQLGVQSPESGPFYVLISDGTPDPKALAALGYSNQKMETLLMERGVQPPAQVFLLCADHRDNIIYLAKEEQICGGGY